MISRAGETATPRTIQPGQAVRLAVHAGIIMDGNARWAEVHGLPREHGHRAGYLNVLRVITGALDLGVGYLTLYAFSTENWGREAGEVETLMNVFANFFRRDVPELALRGVRTRAVGRLRELPSPLRAAISAGAANEPPCPRMELLVALAYGGRAELADAVRRAYAAGDTDALCGDERALARHLYAPDVPPPDLIIRTGGQRRLSNFLLWQAAYSELWFTDTLWPDFGREELAAALREVACRSRTFGGRPLAVRSEVR